MSKHLKTRLLDSSTTTRTKFRSFSSLPLCLSASLPLCLSASLALLTPFQAYGVATITELVWNDPLNGNVTSTDGTGIDIDRESTLVSFTAGTDDFSSFILTNSATSLTVANNNISPLWGLNSVNPLTTADDVLSVTDNRLDTGVVNMNDNAEFYFPASPVNLNDMLFVFDVGSNDGNRSIELIDSTGTVVGSPLNMNFSGSSVAELDYGRINNATTTTVNNAAFKGQAAAISEFGLTVAQLGSVAGVRIDGGGRLDPALVGIAIPEPRIASLLLLGMGAILCRRRRY